MRKPTRVARQITILFCFLTHSMVSDNSLTEEVSQDAQQLRPRPTFPGPAEPSRGTVISVPSSMLGNIRRYREARDAYLRDVAHEAVGSFNPWAVADR